MIRKKRNAWKQDIKETEKRKTLTALGKTCWRNGFNLCTCSTFHWNLLSPSLHSSHIRNVIDMSLIISLFLWCITVQIRRRKIRSWQKDWSSGITNRILSFMIFILEIFWVNRNGLWTRFLPCGHFFQIANEILCGDLQKRLTVPLSESFYIAQMESIAGPEGIHHFYLGDLCFPLDSFLSCASRKR